MEQSESSKPRVLVIEDSDIERQLMEVMLGELGVDVVLASNGKEGQELALSEDADINPFDLILMNIAMPVMDGYTATRQLRDAGYVRPIIVVTSDPVRQKCLEAGCNDFLQKPITLDSLHAVIHRYTKV
ncbi:MAG: response regulator [Chloroflexi bacterium]|nr:response regulator [Chloroflexota bacterium]